MQLICRGGTNRRVSGPGASRKQATVNITQDRLLFFIVSNYRVFTLARREFGLLIALAIIFMFA